MIKDRLTPSRHASLWDAFRGGNQEAFSQLYELFAADLYRYGSSILRLTILTVTATIFWWRLPERRLCFWELLPNPVDAYEVKVNAATAVKFNWNDPVMAANPYANRDPRLVFSIVINNTSFGTPARNVQLRMGGLDGKPIVNASKTGYYLRKYQIESLNLINNNTGVHSWIIFRYP